ncbi:MULTISPECIES: hypothetical protein [unclassified Leifsonia]|uniref:hypothetical protein n=1 Tax=unclassified Leifsonia TaxID=2663824 RepID=UPI0007009D58|nr:MULTISPECIES: hypothetical protein [unclassified Leifsonia]KQX06330.1 hypothetical protein ASC59_00100 [Leifsonia sp. Root1293]KRA10614.1 hypothetical protein ASD61_00100 [Leifsonia sp. Root60]
MTTLTDRYVWAVVRTAPEKQRPELEQEVRGLVADAVDARLEAGSTSPERDAIVELGDPLALAARYADRPLTLIGPEYYLLWLRLLKLLLAIVVPIAAVGIGIGQFVAGAPAGGIIGSMIGGAIQVTVNIGFWTTVVFVIMDRSAKGAPMVVWSPDQLPEVPSPTQRSALGQLVASVAFLVLLIVALVWQQFNPYLAGSGDSLPVLNQELWTFWIPWFIAVTLAEIGFAFAVYFRGWSYPLAAVNIALNLAFTVPAVWLWVEGRLLNPAFVDAAARQTDENFAEAWQITSIIVVAGLVLIATWDVIDGFLNAYRVHHPRLSAQR